MPDTLRIIPLGGLGEVGKNMLAVEYGPDILLIDAGIMFPENDMLGIDFIIPDWQYLSDKVERVRAILITHGHEDHVGALPYLLNEINAPVYTTCLTRGLIEVDLKRHKLLDKVVLHTVAAGDQVVVGPFQVEFFRVCHSIPDAVGLGITTPAGLIVHTGDFKLDYTPVSGKPTDFAKLAELGGRGVLALLSDSTNAERPGNTPSERFVEAALEQVFRDAPGRIIIATFASLISRIQQAIDVACRNGRKFAIAGKTMADNVKMARELGYLQIPHGMQVTLGDIRAIPANKLVILATGAQGEPSAVLSRLATGHHPSLQIEPGDTVVLSSHTIPGNEESIYRVINRLFQRGADVIYSPSAPVHVSGHASQEEQKMLLNIVRPRNFVPIHGELRHLKQHAKTARELGLAAERIAVVENGHVLHLEGDQLRVGKRVPGGYVFVDGNWVGSAVGPTVIREREILATAGICVVALRYDVQRGTLLEAPRLVLHGFVANEVVENVVGEAREAVLRAAKSLNPGTPVATAERTVRRSLADFFYQKTKNRPEIVVLAMGDGAGSDRL